MRVKREIALPRTGYFHFTVFVCLFEVCEISQAVLKLDLKRVIEKVRFPVSNSYGTTLLPPPPPPPTWDH